MKNVQLCKQGIGSFIPGKYHEFLLGRFLEGNNYSLQPVFAAAASKLLFPTSVIWLPSRLRTTTHTQPQGQHPAKPQQQEHHKTLTTD